MFLFFYIGMALIVIATFPGKSIGTFRALFVGPGTRY